MLLQKLLRTHETVNTAFDKMRVILVCLPTKTANIPNFNFDVYFYLDRVTNGHHQYHS